MKTEPYYKTSKITGRTYNLFNICRILNLTQVCYYLEQNVPIEDIEVSEDRKQGNPILVFYFDRDLSKEAYDNWCNREH